MPDPVRTFRHFREVPQNLWRWPNFSPAEIACRGTGALKPHPTALDKLQALRDRLGKPLIVRSAYRSPEPRSGFMHIDLWPARNWGEPFPVRAVPFASETPLAREALAQSRTLRGTGTAGAATVGAAGAEIAQEVLAEAQGAVLPLVSYLEFLRWLFIALALGGMAVAIWARIDDWKRGLR